MQMKTKNTSTEKKMKNQLFKNKVIIKYDDLKEKLASILESENETVQSNDQYNQMLNVLFDENKFKIKNEFDYKEFLKEKLKYLQPMNLDDDDDEKNEVLNRIPSNFTFGHH